MLVMQTAVTELRQAVMHADNLESWKLQSVYPQQQLSNPNTVIPRRAQARWLTPCHFSDIFIVPNLEALQQMV